jgi:hypothetical protein
MTTVSPRTRGDVLEDSGRFGTGRTSLPAARIVTACFGGLCLLASIVLLVGAGLLLAADQHLSQDGYLTSDRLPLAARGYAVATDVVDLTGADPLSAHDWLVGTIRLRVNNGDPSTPVFLGIGRAEDVAGYLDGVRHSTLTEIGDPATSYEEWAGSAPKTRPGDGAVWLAKVEGTGTQTLTWTPDDGPWRAVLMNADGSAGVDLNADVGAKLPVVHAMGVWSIVASLAIAVLGVGLLVVGLRRPTRTSALT